MCVAQGKTTAATVRDHIIPLAEGGRDEASNTQPLCEACHDIKSRQEQRRGVQRGYAGRGGKVVTL